MAHNLRGNFQRFEQAIPNLSPAEAAYVEREQRDALAAWGDKSYERFFNLQEGREYSVREAKTWTTFIVSHLDEIIRETTVHREITLWSRVAQALTDGQRVGGAYRLKKLKVVSDRSLPFRGDDGYDIFFYTAVLQANVIVGNFVAPYLEGSLP